MRNFKKSILERVIKHYGGVNRMAVTLGVSQELIYIWCGRGKVSDKMALLIESLTGGDFSCVALSGLVQNEEKFAGLPAKCLKDVIYTFGSCSHTARALRVTPAQVSRWNATGHMSCENAIRLQSRNSKKFRAAKLVDKNVLKQTTECEVRFYD